MATSMAAALMASMPAAQPALAPAAPTYEAIPPSMSKVMDLEAEIPLTNVQLDGLVVTKIVKHANSVPPYSAMGLLVGIDLDGILEVSNSFPLPAMSDEEEKSFKSMARYQTQMLRCLKEVQADDSVVGFYQSNTLGAFFKQSLLDIQAIQRDRLRYGGIVVVHDVTQASRGNAAFHAYRLTKTFHATFKANNFSTQGLIDNKLTFSSIMEEIPIRIRSNPLLGAFVKTLTTPDPVLGTSTHALPQAPLPPSYSSLDYAPQNMTTGLSLVLDALDEYKSEEGTLAFHARNIARDRNRANEAIQKRKDENAVRVSQGFAPLPEEDIARQFKLPPEPSRLKSMLLLGQVDAYSRSLASASSEGLVKMHAANASSSS